LLLSTKLKTLMMTIKLLLLKKYDTVYSITFLCRIKITNFLGKSDQTRFKRRSQGWNQQNSFERNQVASGVETSSHHWPFGCIWASIKCVSGI